MADMNVTGGFGTVALTPPSGTSLTQTVIFTSKEVAFVVEGLQSNVMRVTKSVANIVTGIQQNNLVIGKEVAYAVLRTIPVNRRRASWLFIGNVPT